MLRGTLKSLRDKINAKATQLAEEQFNRATARKKKKVEKKKIKGNKNEQKKRKIRKRK